MKTSPILGALALLLALVFGVGVVQAGEAAGAERPALPRSLQQVKFAGGDGSSCEKAVVIRNAANQVAGVAAEKAWIAWKYPNAKIKKQAVTGARNKTFDVLDIATGDSESKTICFDITDFFGQW